MTIEATLMAGLSAVTSVLVVIAKLLWNEMLTCKHDRETIHAELTTIRDIHLNYVTQQADKFHEAVLRNTEALDKNSEILKQLIK